MGQTMSYGLNQVEVDEMVALCNGSCEHSVQDVGVTSVGNPCTVCDTVTSCAKCSHPGGDRSSV